MQMKLQWQKEKEEKEKRCSLAAFNDHCTALLLS